jgi:hypothetical protein
MDLNNDTSKLSSLLKIPLSEIKYATYFCELILNQTTIGYLPVTIENDVIAYDTNTQFIQKLDWQKIYALQRRQIDEQISKELNLTSFRVLPIAFRRLYVENEQGYLLASFTCIFENDSWIVRDEQLLHRDQVIS